MITRAVTIMNRLGLHARAAAKLVEVASQHDCRVWLVRDGHEADAKSIMNVMMLAAAKGTTIDIRADGEGAAQAVERIAGLVHDRFGEPE